MSSLRIGIDTGGTFTDVAVVEGGRLTIHKLPSTPDDPARAVLEGVARARQGHGPSTEVDVVHGTTVGLNAILTGELARTTFITNDGFRDLVEIGRQDRPDIYDLEPAPREFPVPRARRLTVAHRRDVAGTALATPSAAELRSLHAAIARARPQAIAIGLLHSHIHGDDERDLARRLGAAFGVPITCSAELAPVAGEYERFATAVLNAGIAPIMGAYLDRLIRGVEPGRIRLMRSSGGIMSADEAHRHPALAVFSGPAGGIAAASRLARTLRVPCVATLDMGGTSTDVALAHADATDPNAQTRQATIAGLPLATPAVDIHTIGCGGGSVAFADASGDALRVGPRSAGAHPGPACYGHGDEPTVTDAHVALGHIGAATLLGGGFPIEPARSVAAIERLARGLGLSGLACARGILEIADLAMMRALLLVTVERRIDPAGLPLVAFGGAGGLHAASLGRRLGMGLAVVPASPGAFSAVGLALSGESTEAAEALHVRLDRIDSRELTHRLRTLQRSVVAQLGGRRSVGCEAAVRLRFVGQGSGLWLPQSRDLERDFRQLHLRRFGFDPAGRAIEVVELRARAEGRGLDLPIEATRTPQGRRGARVAPRTSRRPLVGRSAPLTVYAREDLFVGHAPIAGPALIEEMTGVVLVPEGCTAAILPGGLHLILGGKGPTTPPVGRGRRGGHGAND